MAFTEVSSQSWFSRIGGSIKGVLFGLVLFVIAFPVLFWNEGRAVETFKTLNEGSGVVINAPADVLDSANEGKLIHVSGYANTSNILTDAIMNISTTAIKLSRNVHMFQWVESSESETKKKVGGGTTTTTTYSYYKEWSSSHHDSNQFKEQSGHQNPSAMPYQSTSWTAPKVNIGPYRLSQSLVGDIQNSEVFPVPVNHPNVGNLHESRGILTSQQNSEPQVGDIKVTYRAIMPTDVSVIAQQNGDTFIPYQADAGGNILMLEHGIVTAESMFVSAHADNVAMTWMLRIVGFFIMFFGIRMMFKVFVVLADVVPFLGSIANAGVGLISFVITLALSALTIGIAWIFYRPLLGISIIAITAGAIWWTRNKVKATPSTPPAPPASMPPAP